MKYSETILTDDNFDDELEKLLNVIGKCGKEYDGFVDKLDDSFKKQENELGFEEWIKTTKGLHMDISAMHAGVSQACKEGKIAYEFGNGFIILNFVDVL